MLPDPLHPAVVHLPVALALLLPLAALWSLLAARRGGAGGRAAWLPTAALAALFAVVGWAAEETGEEEEERVEELVAGGLVHDHEEAGERLKTASFVVAAVALLGLAGGRFGAVARGATLLLALVALVLGLQAGKSGGALVHGPGGLADGTQPRAAPDD